NSTTWSETIVAFLSLLCLLSLPICSETIAEKMAGALSRSSEDRVHIEALLKEVNERLFTLRSELDACYAKARALQAQEAAPDEFGALLFEVNRIRDEMRRLHEGWHASVTEDSKKNEDGYGLWDQQETTLAQLV